MVAVIDELRPRSAEGEESVMSNYDHEINEEIAEQLRAGTTDVASYPAWNFNATVWFAAGCWKCDIWQYHHHVVTVAADELREIMEWASNEYGAE